MFEGIKRSASIWKEAKKAEKERPVIKRKRSDYEFLPAVIEVMETPASPVGRGVMLSIGVFLIIAVVWAWFGKIDVVSSANGKIVPSDYVKYIQASEIGVVRAIHVKNGQSVKAGEVLIELDPTDSAADLDRLTQEKMTAELELARLKALAVSIPKALDSFEPPEGADPGRIALQKQRILSEIAEYKARDIYFKEELARRQAQMSVANARIGKLKATLPYIRQQVDAIALLEGKGHASKLRLLELQRAQVESEQDLITEKAAIHEVKASIAALKQEAIREKTEKQTTRLTELNEAERQLQAVIQEILKAERRNTLRQLKAPVDGKVQQMVVHTIGGVVEAAAPLMVIVPEGSAFVVEAKVLNKDIGFVEEGQDAEIKLEAFPYTKYGVIHGKVLHLSPDAIEDENLGLVYDARIEMAANQIQVDNKMVNVSAGMAATVEVKTGKRRVLEYVLTPLLRYKQEALRER